MPHCSKPFMDNSKSHVPGIDRRWRRKRLNGLKAEAKREVIGRANSLALSVFIPSIRLRRAPREDQPSLGPSNRRQQTTSQVSKERRSTSLRLRAFVIIMLGVKRDQASGSGR